MESTFPESLEVGGRYTQRAGGRKCGRGPAQALIELMVEARKKHGYGPLRTKIWLERVHKLVAAEATIRRIMKDMAVPRAGRPVRRRRPRQLKLFEKERPGEPV